MAVRAKFHLCSVTHHKWGGQTLHFDTRYDDTIPEDVRFQKATPSGSITMLVDNPTAQSQFEMGCDYYADFTLAPKPEKKPGA